jgi:hypothetical protein
MIKINKKIPKEDIIQSERYQIINILKLYGWFIFIKTIIKLPPNLAFILERDDLKDLFFGININQLFMDGLRKFHLLQQVYLILGNNLINILISFWFLRKYLLST